MYLSGVVLFQWMIERFSFSGVFVHMLHHLKIAILVCMDDYVLLNTRNFQCKQQLLMILF